MNDDILATFDTQTLMDLYRIARDGAGWSNNSLAYDFGETLVANSPDGYHEDDDGNTLDDFAAIGEAAIARLESEGAYLAN